MLRDMPASRHEVTANVRTVREAIERAAERAGRDPETVELVAAAKTVPPEVIGRVIDAGVRSVGQSAPRDRASGSV